LLPFHTLACCLAMVCPALQLSDTTASLYEAIETAEAVLLSRNSYNSANDSESDDDVAAAAAAAPTPAPRKRRTVRKAAAAVEVAEGVAAADAAVAAPRKRRGSRKAVAAAAA
jgi:hypothetical protein